MIQKKRIWVVSEVFYPDTDIATANIATEIALKFRDDFEVHVICGPQDYERKNNTRQEARLPGIHIHRWKYFNYNKNHTFQRLLRVVGISLGLFLLGFKIKKGDKAFVISNPAFITPLYAFLKWCKGFKYLMLMHDVFPENLVTGGYIKESSALYKITRKIFIRSRIACDKIIVIGRDMKELLMKNFPSSRDEDIVIIPNWADIEAIFPLEQQHNPLAEKLGITDKVVVLFAGNHGVLQNLKAFLQIVKHTRNNELHFVFAGGGATKKELESFVQTNRLSNVSFLPPFPRAENNHILNACHIGLVSLRDELYGVGVPSKSYNILGAGKPILFLGNIQTEIAQFVLENDLGWAFTYSDAANASLFLNSLSIAHLKEIQQKGAKGRKLVEEKYSKEYVLTMLNTYVASW